MRPEFWSGRRVFITGHSGFKGSWLSLWLQRMNAQVTGFSLPPPTEPNLFCRAQIDEGMDSIIGDIRDLEPLTKSLVSSRAEIVFHLAAQSLVRRSYDDPIETFAVNALGTAHLLEAVRHAPAVRAVVIVTSDKCYENREWLWGYREDEAMGGHDPYSSSKGCAELITAAYARSFFPAAGYDSHRVAIASARAGNVIGGGDWATDRLLPDIVRAIQAGEPVCIRNPRAVRPWQHVLEPLRGYLGLAESLYAQGAAFNGGWNFGPSEEDAQPVSWIADTMTDRWGCGATWKSDAAVQPHEAHTLKLDCSKAHALLGWRPILRLAEALDAIVAWYQDYARSPEDPRHVRSLVIREIERYEELVAC